MSQKQSRKRLVMRDDHSQNRVNRIQSAKDPSYARQRAAQGKGLGNLNVSSDKIDWEKEYQIQVKNKANKAKSKIFEMVDKIERGELVNDVNSDSLDLKLNQDHSAFLENRAAI